MAHTPRDTVTYDLKDGHRVVYRGTTDDPERREREHHAEGKRFTRMTITSAKLARREGIDFILDPMWHPIRPDLHEHIDGLQSVCAKPTAR